MNIVLEIQRCAKVENEYRDRENPMYVLPTEREKKESFKFVILLNIKKNLQTTLRCIFNNLLEPIFFNNRYKID